MLTFLKIKINTKIYFLHEKCNNYLYFFLNFRKVSDSAIIQQILNILYKKVSHFRQKVSIVFNKLPADLSTKVSKLSNLVTSKSK